MRKSCGFVSSSPPDDGIGGLRLIKNTHIHRKCKKCEVKEKGKSEAWIDKKKTKRVRKKKKQRMGRRMEKRE